MKIRNAFFSGLMLLSTGLLHEGHAAEPLFGGVDISQQVLTNNTTYVVFSYTDWGMAEGVGPGAFIDAEVAAEETSRTYTTNYWNWATTNQNKWAFAHTFSDWGWTPQQTWAGRGDIIWQVQANLSGISSSEYSHVCLLFDVEKWKGARYGDPDWTPNALAYETVRYGSILPFGQVTPLTDTLVPPWPEYGCDEYVNALEDEDAYYSRWYLFTPRVYGFTQNYEVYFEEINPHPSLAPVSDPVNAISGNVRVDATDIVLPCAGMPLAFTRSYNSVLDYDGPLGHRWTHSYNWLLTDASTIFGSTTNTWKVLQTGEGRQFYFQSMGGGLFACPVDNNWRLAVSGTNAYELTLPGGVTCTFDLNGVLQSISDSWENAVTLTYSNSFPSHLLTRVEHTDGRYLDCLYSNNLLSQVKSPSTNLYVNFFYNAQNELTNATRVVAGTSYPSSYAYDYDASWCNHSLTQRVNAAGDTFSWEYETDGAGHITSKGTRTTVSTNLMDATLAYATNGEYKTTVSYNRAGNNLAYDYYHHPVLRRILEVRGPNPVATNWASTGKGLSHEFDDQGNATNSITYDHETARWFQVRRDFDAAHNVTNDAFGYGSYPSNSWAYSWNTNWNVLTGVTDPEGGKVEFEYTNAALSRAKLYYDSGNSWDSLFGYTAAGLLSGVTNANGHWVNYYHDAYGNMTSVVPQVGPVILSTFTSLGYLQKLELPPYTFFADTSDPGSTNGIWLYRTTTFDVNELGWIAKVTYPDPVTGNTNGPYEAYQRNALGDVTNHVDIAGRSIRYSWLPTHRLDSVTRTANGTNVTASLSYDDQFNVLSVKDPLGRAVESYGLDDQDRTVAITNIEGQVMAISYAVGDFVQSITRFDGTTLSNACNSAGLLSNIQYPGSSIQLTYLKNGLLLVSSNALPGGSIARMTCFWPTCAP